MFKFFLTANVQAEAATEVNAAALGLNCVFAVVLSRVAGVVGRLVRTGGDVDRSYREVLGGDPLFSKGWRNLGDFVCGVGLILVGVGLLGRRRRGGSRAGSSVTQGGKGEESKKKQ